jgi:hypothetical protein
VQDQCHHSSIIIYCLRKANETLTKQKVGLRVRENLGLGLKFNPNFLKSLNYAYNVSSRYYYAIDRLEKNYITPFYYNFVK